MSSFTLLDKDLPVLFAYIGWAHWYDGTEAVVGGHAYLDEHPLDNAEARAFVKDPDGRYQCGIGQGRTPAKLHIVFVSTDPIHQSKKVVGLYADADIQFTPLQAKNNKVRRVWADATTTHALWIPPDRRPVLSGWQPGRGQRRWASLPKGKSYGALLNTFHALKRQLPGLVTGIPGRDGEDQIYSGIEAREGEQQKRLQTHRTREAKLRLAKIHDALTRGGGRLRCEVPGCGFDFADAYGTNGIGYAQVHHKVPLYAAPREGRTNSIADLAIVCANCHAIIHRDGRCLALDEVIPVP